MRTTVDTAGRLVIPKQICRDGRVEIELAETPQRLEWQDGLLVALPEGAGPPLTAEVVEQTRTEIMDQRRHAGSSF